LSEIFSQFLSLSQRMYGAVLPGQRNG